MVLRGASDPGRSRRLADVAGAGAGKAVEAVAFSPDDAVGSHGLTRAEAHHDQHRTGNGACCGVGVLARRSRALRRRERGRRTLFDVTQRAQPHLLGTISADGTQLVNAITFSPSGKLLATGNTDGSAHLWDVGNLSHPALVSTFSVGTSRAVDAVAISPDGKTLITVGEHGTDLAWDLTGSTAPRLLAGIRAEANSPTAPTAARSRPRRTASP